MSEVKIVTYDSDGKEIPSVTTISESGRVYMTTFDKPIDCMMDTELTHKIEIVESEAPLT